MEGNGKGERECNQDETAGADSRRRQPFHHGALGEKRKGCDSQDKQEKCRIQRRRSSTKPSFQSDQSYSVTMLSPSSPLRINEYKRAGGRPEAEGEMPDCLSQCEIFKEREQRHQRDINRHD